MTAYQQDLAKTGVRTRDGDGSILLEMTYTENHAQLAENKQQCCVPKALINFL